ncbi:hypothetical protein RDI58_015185 [Solanum bulbocastanum]|uniref:Uncharacterized protein n=1 Tax=Solanum bulbocastanum TaxID=147425 RepID=A0AAN8TGG7_SOLBU
MHRGVHWIH